MPSVGYATIQIIPSVRGIADELRRQLVGPAGEAGTSAGQESGARFGDSFKGGMAAIGAAAGALLVAATVSAVEKEKVGDQLAAQLGLSGPGAQQAGKLAGDLYSRAVVDSFEDGAATVRAVMGSGLIPADATNADIESITTQVADLANTFGQDLTGTANAAAQMIRTGLAEDGTQALDLLTKGFQSNTDKAGDFLDTINEYGTQFRKAGLDGATAVGLMNQAIAAGARDSDIAADAIKEFSIRAVDGSKTTADGYKLLGLSADDMAKKFGAGGASATAALDLTLDRLRDIEDPVKQSQAAVALFGTQAEDLGQALFAMDPSSAAKGLGEFGGAAAKVGDVIRGNTATQLAILQRQLMGALGTVVTSVVLPALLGLIRGIRTTGDVISGVVDWFREWGIWLAPLGILIGGVTLALNAQAIATGAVSAVFGVYRAVILAGTAVTNGFAAAQALLNSVMALNPITLVVIALVALGAALFIAWKKSETFRAVVTAAWQGIQEAALWAWNGVLKPVIGWFGDIVTWLWTSIIKPYFGLVMLYFRTLGTVAMWLWNNAISPAFNGIAAVVTWWWTSIVQPYFALVMGAFRAVGAIAMWLWNNAIKPAFDGIAAVISWWWTSIVQRYFNLVRGAISTLGAAFGWLYTHAVKPAWNAMSATIAAVWNGGIKPTFALLERGVDAVARSFDSAVEFIARVWDGLREATKTPVNFVVDTVYNNGIRNVWNTVARLVGMDTLDPVKFARGGRTRGGIPGKDSIPALMMADEYVIKRDSARKIGFGALDYMNRTGEVPVQRFADGGIVGWAKDLGGRALGGFKAAADVVMDPVGALRHLFRGVTDGISEFTDNGWGRLIAEIPDHIMDELLGFSGRNAAASGSGSWTRPVAAAIGTRYGVPGRMWSSGYHTGTDFPAAVGAAVRAVANGAVQSVLSGGPYGNHLWLAHPGGMRSLYAHLSSMGVRVGQTVTAGQRIGGVGATGNVTGPHLHLEAWRGSERVNPETLFDSGGWLMPGATVVRNRTGAPEPVLTTRQLRALEGAAVAGTDRQPAVLEGDLYLDSGEFLGTVRGVVREEFRPLTTALRTNRRG